MEKKQTTIMISYAITVCNEARELERLLTALQPYLQDTDEIVVQADQKNVTQEVKDVAKRFDSIITTYAEYPLNYDFAAAKNHLNSLCKGEYIFQLDADEVPQPWLLEHLPHILRRYFWVDLFKLPRINLFDDTTEREAWPDYQGRIYRNRPRIHWHRPLHERIKGHIFSWHLPKKDEYALLHLKDREQNAAKWEEWQRHYDKRTTL